MPGTETGIKLRGIVQLKPWTQKRFNEVSFLVRFHMPGKPRNRRLEARLTQRNSLVRNNDYPTTESLQRDRTAVRAFCRLSRFEPSAELLRRRLPVREERD